MGINLSKVFIFAAGAAIGSIATWIIMDEKCRMLEEDVNASRELYLSDRHDSENATVAENRKSDEKPDISEYINKVKECGYSEEPETEEERPYLIEPGEFGMIDDYDEYSLTYWADGVLSDDDNNDRQIEEDIDDVIGVEALDMFGEHEEGVVHIRNDRLKADYEVTRDTRNYADVVGNEMED